MKRFLIVVLSIICLATTSDAQVQVLQQGFSGWELDARKQIQCMLQQKGMYDGALDGVYGPGTEAGLLAAYSAIGPDRVHQGRGGLNNDREVYYFLYGFVDKDWGYELFAGERSTCLNLQTGTPSGINYSVTYSECGQLIDRNITVFPDRFEFWESSCSILAKEQVSADTLLLSLNCTGEGQQWIRQERLSYLSDGRLRLGDQTYLRCPR